jgi:hypothetical protein
MKQTYPLGVRATSGKERPPVLMKQTYPLGVRATSGKERPPVSAWIVDGKINHFTIFYFTRVLSLLHLAFHFYQHL